MTPISLKLTASGQQELSQDNLVLFTTQQGGKKAEVFWERGSEALRGRVFEEGEMKPAVLSGISIAERRATEEELGEVRRFFEGAAVRVQGGRIEVWPKLLGGAPGTDGPLTPNENKELERLEKRGKWKSNLPRVQAILLDSRLTKLEEDIRSEKIDSKDLCRIRTILLEIMEENEGCHLVVFERALEALIHSLALWKSHYDEDTANNLAYIYTKLWKKIEPLLSSSPIDSLKLEKLTQAFGFILRELNIFYSSGRVAVPANIKSEIEKINKKNISVNRKYENKFRIEYYFAFIREAAMKLDTLSRGSKAKNTAEDVVWEIVKSASVCFSLSIPPSISMGLSMENLIKAGYKGYSGIKDMLQTNKSWYDHALILMKMENKAIHAVENEETDNDEPESETVTFDDLLNSIRDEPLKKSWQWHYTNIEFLRNVIKHTNNETIRKSAIEEFSRYCRNREVWRRKHRNIQSQLLQTFLELILDDIVEAQVYEACIGMNSIEGNGTRSYSRENYGKIEFLRQVILHSNNEHLKKNAIEQLVSYKENWTEWHKKTIRTNKEKDYFCKNWFQIIEEWKKNRALDPKHGRFDDNYLAYENRVFFLQSDHRLENTKDTEGERRAEMDRFARSKKEDRIFWNRGRASEEETQASSISKDENPIVSPKKPSITTSIVINSEENLSFLDIDVEGGGACLFRGISLGLESTIDSANPKLSHEELREKAASYIAQNSESHFESIKAQLRTLFEENRQFLGDPDNLFHGIPAAFKAKLTKALVADSEETYINSDKGVNDYIDHMFDPTAWGGEIELGVLAKLLKVELVVYDNASARQPIQRVGESGNHKIYLLHTGGHYKLRLPIRDNVSSPVPLLQSPPLISTQKTLDICVYDRPVGNFIGREMELEAIKRKLPPATKDNEKTKIVVLTGLWGVGKTQVARKFVAQCFARYSMVYTFDGQSEETLHQGYKDLVFRLSGVNMIQDSLVDVRNRVNALLEKKDNKGWLLLFDNVDDPKLLCPLYEEQLPKQGGCVLITSRSHLGNAEVDIPINEFKRDEQGKCVESIALLKTIIPSNRQCSEKILDELAKELGDLPLALVQAGAYIKNSKARRYDTSVHLTSFKRSYADSTTRFKRFRNEPPAAYHNRLTVTTTWDTSRKRIREECPLADEALCLLAYFNPDEIATDWIERWLEKRGINVEEMDVGDHMTNIIDVLRDDYSMIRYDEEKGEISVHRLVQQVVRKSLDERKQRELIPEALKLVKEKFDGYDDDDPKTWGIGRECLPHAISVANHVSKHYPDFHGLENSEREIPKQMGALFSQMGAYTLGQGIASQAIEYYEKALEMTKTFLGESHPSVAFTLHNLGNAWNSSGEKKKAIEYYEKALEMKKVFLGESHPSVADTLNNLGIAWSELGEKKKAIEYYEQALEMTKTFLGESHPSVADTLNNLGIAWSELGENKKAIEYYEKALEMKKAFLGESHPSVAETLNNLGIAWSELGENKKAIEYYEKALEMKKAFLGESHPSVADTLNNLGIAWSELGENKKAIEYYEKALEMTKAFLGESHPSVAETLNNLGIAWSSLRENKKAIEYFEKALEMTTAFLGESHPSVAETLKNLGIAWSELGEKKKAIEYFEKASEMKKAFLGESHPSVAKTLNNPRNAWSELGENKKAIEYFEKALEMTKAFSGESHPSVAVALNNLGIAWNDLGENKKAIEYFEKALEMKKAFLGESHLSVADTLNNLGNAWSNLGENKKAIEYFKKTLEMTKAFLGENHPSVAVALNNLGNAWNDLGENKKAIEYYEKALKMTKAFLGENHLLVTDTLNNLGNAWSKLGENKKAIEYYEKALEMTKAFLGENHPSVAVTLNNLGFAWSNLGDDKKALQYYEKALEIYKTFYGDSHPSIALTLSNSGEAYCNLKNYDKALSLGKEAVTMKMAMYPDGHSFTCIILNNLGKTQFKTKNFQESLTLHQQALTLAEKLNPDHPNHPDRARSLLGLGNALRGKNKLQDSLNSLKKAHKAFRITYTKNHPDTAKCHHALGQTYQALNQNHKARKHYQKALETALHFFPKDHPDLLKYKESAESLL